MTFAEEVAALRRTINRVLRRRLHTRTKSPFLDLRALRVVAAKEARTQVELAERLLIDAPSASRLASKLVAQGLMRTRRAGSDRRCVELEVTSKAAEKIAVLDGELQSLEALLRQHLGRRALDAARVTVSQARELLLEELAEPERAPAQVPGRRKRPGRSRRTA